MHYYLSFLRGQDRENRIPSGSESLYLSTEFSGMCMWKGEQGDGDHREADFAG